MPVNSPEYDEAVETNWDGVDQSEFENFEQFASVHVWHNTEDPETSEDVELPVAHMEDGTLKLVYEALNSAHDLASQAIDDEEDVSQVRDLLEDLREDEFPDREPLDADQESRAVEDVDLTPPDAVQNAAQAAMDFEEENDDIQDCGTGVGDMRAEQIINDDLEPEDFLGGENTAIPDYLESHEEDVTAEGPATDWSDEEMDDCGNRQYAKWGGTGTGTGLEWAEETEQRLREEMEDEEDENNTMSSEQNEDDTREINQLSQKELKEISEKAGTEDAPKVHKHFQINSKDIKQGEDENGNPIYKVPISGDARDRDRDKMALDAQEEMTDQLRSGKIPVFGDHGRASDAPRYSFTNILGQFIDGELDTIQNQERNEGERVTLADMRLRTSHPDAKEMEELLEGDWPVGFSVGFIPTEVEEITNDEGELTGLKVLDLDLMEASAVGIPSQPDSVPVGISQNSTQAAVAMKSVLDETGKEVDVDDLEKSLKNVIGDESMEQNEEEAGDSPDDTNSSFVEENRDSFKTLIKESLRDLKSEDLEKRMEKAPENVSEGDLQNFFADHFDDMDMSDVEQAIDQSDAEYIGQLDLSAYAKLLATAYDAGQDEVLNIMEEIIDQLEEMEDGEDGEENDSDPDEEDDQDPDEENEMDEEEDGEGMDEDDEEEEMDEENMTDPDKSTGPEGSGPIQRAGDDDDEKGDVELSDDLDEDELEDLSFGGRP